ncbi:SelA-like pyridoxal phosphate-dependent enzyme [Chloroflexi bacterium TSY]|nr:SelA-like pyridoxal phosphate-dependent enzyme [Chloroflexi bacterium TSY]
MDLLDELRVRRVINASGRMTNLGVNTLNDSVLEAMALAGRNYVDIDQLQRAVGREVASLIGAEDAMITTGAAAGVALMVAACIAGNDLTRIQALPDPNDRPNDVLIQAGHQISFGAQITQLIRLAGGQPQPVGSVSSVSEAHLTGAIGPNVAAFLFVQSHHAVQKGMLSLSHCIQLCQEHGVPVLVDAAAEEDLIHFVTSGVDLVTFSGGKAIGGPTSGIVAGQPDLVEACRAQNAGIGRPMKVGKEALLGLWTAVMDYMQRNVQVEQKRNAAIVDELLIGFGHFAKTQRLRDEAGRGIERAAIVLDPKEAAELVAFLRNGTPPIYPRGHLLNLGIVAFDPRPLAEQDVERIVARVRDYFDSGRQIYGTL